jgi:hypothetical protein
MAVRFPGSRIAERRGGRGRDRPGHRDAASDVCYSSGAQARIAAYYAGLGVDP